VDGLVVPADLKSVLQRVIVLFALAMWCTKIRLAGWLSVTNASDGGRADHSAQL
jgi:hypothetical protein